MTKIKTMLVQVPAVLLFLLAAFGISAALSLMSSTERPEQEGYILGEHSWPVHCLAFAPDGKTLAAGGGGGFPDPEGAVTLWDVTTGQVRVNLRGHQTIVGALAFAPDGQTLATLSLDRVVRLWDVATGQERARAARFPEYTSLPLAFSATSQTLAFASSESGVVMLWQLVPGPERAPGAGVDRFAFAEGGGIAPWRAAPEARLARPDVRSLARVGEIEGWLPLNLWDLSTGQEPFRLRGHSNRIAALAFSANGQTLASGSFDQTVKLWDVATGRELATLRGHTDQVNAVAFAPDSRLLASASHDRTVRLWDPAMGWEQAILNGHMGAATCVAFAPDGQWLASGSYDKTVRLWPVDNDP